MNGRGTIKYFGYNDNVHSNGIEFESQILCSNCTEALECGITGLYGGMSWHAKDFSLAGKIELRWKVRFAGRPNGDEKVTVWENSNCSPAGQTLTFQATYEEGTTETSATSSGHSVGTGIDVRGKTEFENNFFAIAMKISIEAGFHINYGHDWSSSTQLMKQVRTSKTITVKIPPGQKAALKQWKGQFGDLEVLSSVEYVAEYCPVQIPTTAVAADKDQRIFHRPNCSPGNPEFGAKIFYNKGISVLGKNWNHAETVSAANPEVIKAIEIAIERSKTLKRKNDWMAMDLKYQARIYEQNLEFNTCNGLSIPPGKVLSVYQLVLTYGPYIVYSNKVWPVYTNCP